jgi:hypothetical protein
LFRSRAGSLADELVTGIPPATGELVFPADLTEELPRPALGL